MSDQPRDQEIAQARRTVEAKRVQDTLIMQKVNAAHREAFHEKFPGQIEHCMRLIAERLQQGLRKDSDMQLSDCSAKDLSWALLNLWTIHSDIQDNTGR
jgi:hypothetical protein